MNRICLAVTFMLLASQASACPSAVKLKGLSMGGLPRDHELRICQKGQNTVALEVSILGYEDRELEVSRDTFERYWRAIQLAFDEAMKVPTAGALGCNHRVGAQLSWDGLERFFSACDHDPRSILIRKLTDTIEFLYREPGN